MKWPTQSQRPRRVRGPLGVLSREKLALLCLDLDRFKEVSDTLGHPIGDSLLVEVSARLRSQLRETDSLARLGGDEFAIIQSGLATLNDSDILRFSAERDDYGPGDVDRLIAVRLARAKVRKPHSFERPGPDGTAIEIRGAPVQAGGFVTTFMDITERKRSDVLRDGQAQIIEMIAISAPLEDVLDQLIRLVESQLTGIFGSVLLLDPCGLHLWYGAGPSLPEIYRNAIDSVRIGPDVGSCGTAAYRRKAVVVTDIMHDPPWRNFRDLAAAHGFRSCWSTPIFSHQSEVLGTFAMYSASVREPTSAEMQLIEISTRIAGIAIQRKQAKDRVHFMANHDALTGLPNRALLNDRLSQAVLNAQRYDRRVTVVFIDLDHFKAVNNIHGHNAGDELLKLVATRMVDCLRATDTVVRLGGDEFVILFADEPKNSDVTTETLLKIGTAIAEPFHLEGHELRVTSSIGVANYPDDGADANTLLAHADAAMYRAKEIGRDNFQFYTPDLNAKAHEKLLLQKE